MTTEEAFVKVLQRHGIDHARDHRIGDDADLGPFYARRHPVLGLRI